MGLSEELAPGFSFSAFGGSSARNPGSLADGPIQHERLPWCLWSMPNAAAPTPSLGQELACPPPTQTARARKCRNYRKPQRRRPPMQMVRGCCPGSLEEGQSEARKQLQKVAGKRTQMRRFGGGRRIQKPGRTKRSDLCACRLARTSQATEHLEDGPPTLRSPATLEGQRLSGALGVREPGAYAVAQLYWRSPGIATGPKCPPEERDNHFLTKISPNSARGRIKHHCASCDFTASDADAASAIAR